jgi:hypothetical protein
MPGWAQQVYSPIISAEVDQRFRPEMKLKIKTTSAMTRSKWMSEPAM